MQENKYARASQDRNSALPFFARFLEGQNSEGEGFQTLKFPSDRDEGDQTMKYPSDNDEGDDRHNFAG
jgi:hypothetical protein